MKLFYWAWFFIGLAFVACDSSDGDGPVTTGDKRASIELDNADVYASADYEFVLPQPFALAANFQEAGLNYDEQRMNNVDKASTYKTKGKKLLNFGVYSTNLVYAILNERPQASLKYFRTLQELAESIGMGAVFAEDNLAEKIEKNIVNKEVMEDLLIDLHERSQEYLMDNDMRKLAAIQFTGAWIEAMYLASHDFEDEVDLTVSSKIDDQMTLIDNAIHAIETFENEDDDLLKVYEELLRFQKEYIDFESVKNPVDGIPQLTSEEVNLLKRQIQSIRQLIVA